jgi:pimeloyl-ACP methyl ester carboxylesterase
MMQGHALEMAYMDVAPTVPASGQTVLLLHGKNFSGAYWEATIDALTAVGHRVIVPDQIGFGKSSKPTDVQYSFHELVRHTTTLLDQLGVDQVTVVGHSMGGMVASRFAIDHPERTARLVLLNPIGLEDYQRFAPYKTVDAWHQAESGKTPERIRAYMQESYFDGQWTPAYDALVALQAGFVTGPDADQIARVSALTYDMIYTQPVANEWDRITSPTLLVIGERDRTALLKGAVTDEVRATMGRYDTLGERTSAAIAGSTLVEFPSVGHLPQFERTDETHAAILSFIAGSPVPGASTD